jgi:putative transposase
VTDEAIALLAPRIGTRAACAASGVPQATWYRRHRISPPPPKPAPVPHTRRVQPRALAPAERTAIGDALHCDRFADLAPDEVWATLLDEGCAFRPGGRATPPDRRPRWSGRSPDVPR